MSSLLLLLLLCIMASMIDRNVSGLTRAEVTFYVDDDLPSNAFMQRMLQQVVKYVPANLVLASPYASQWKALCECLQHSVVVVSPEMNIALVGLWWNELTKKISGYFVKDWAAKERFVLANATLASNLPIDKVCCIHVPYIFYTG